MVRMARVDSRNRTARSSASDSTEVTWRLGRKRRLVLLLAWLTLLPTSTPLPVMLHRRDMGKSLDRKGGDKPRGRPDFYGKRPGPSSRGARPGLLRRLGGLSGCSRGRPPRQKQGAARRRDPDDGAPVRVLARDQPAIDRILPNREPGARGAPRFHHFGVAPLGV